MRTWITLIGHKPLAAVNTLWAVLKEENSGEIERLILFYSENMRKEKTIFLKWARLLLSEYQIKIPEIIEETFPADDLKYFRLLLKRTVSKTDGKIMMDMTSGRKAMSALMLLIGDLYRGKVDKVYYSHLKDYDYTNYPYPLIPFSVSQLYNMLEN